MEQFLGSPVGILIAMLLAVLLFTGIAAATRSTVVELPEAWGKRTLFITGCVVFVLLLRWNLLYDRTYPVRDKLALWNALTFTLAVSLSATLFEGSFNYKVPLFYAAILAWIAWCWCYCHMTDEQFGLARGSVPVMGEVIGQAGRRYFKVMDFLLSGYAILMSFFYLGMIPAFGYTAAPLASLQKMHWLLDIRWLFSILIIAASIVRAAIVALSAGVDVKDPFPKSSAADRWYTPVLEVFKAVVNAIARTVATLVQYIMKIGWEWLKSLGHHALRLRNAAISIVVMGSFLLGCLGLRHMVAELWSYQMINDMMPALWPFVKLLGLFVAMILAALLINFLMHCKVERWLKLIDVEDWSTFSTKRSLAAPAFVAFALWFASLVLLGLSYVESWGLTVYRHAGPFVFLVLSTMVIGGVYLALRARKAAHSNKTAA